MLSRTNKFSVFCIKSKITEQEDDDDDNNNNNIEKVKIIDAYDNILSVITYEDAANISKNENKSNLLSLTYGEVKKLTLL
jgi:hypothetical protein